VFLAGIEGSGSFDFPSSVVPQFVWSLEEIVIMADSYIPKPGKRGPYKNK
jgi:hypothetical protein